MDKMASLVKRAAERCGFTREYFVEDDVPTVSSNIVVLPFFGNPSSCSILSQYVLRRYKEMRTTKYLILASWPGYRHLFPYVDEFWSPRDESSVQALASKCDDFYNDSDLVSEFNRFLINHFENVISYDDLRPYYDHGFGTKFWENFKGVKCFLPEVPSGTMLPQDFQSDLSRRRGPKVAIFPAKRLRSWQNGQCVHLPVHRDFWVVLTERLLAEGYTPVVHQNWFTYNLSTDFTDRCAWLTSKDMGQVLSGLRAAGCFLDIHSGFSRIAAAARCPSLIVDERQRYVAHKEYELDDLTPTGTPRQYVFSFSTRLMTGGAPEWNLSLLDGIVSRLEKWLPSLDKSSWGPTNELYDEVSYDAVRQHKSMRLGVRFIRKY